MRAGYVYALTNPDYPGSFKIGMTTKSPEERARQLSADTGVRSPFAVFRSVHTPCADGHEKIAHDILKARRIDPSKEFFQMDDEEVGRFFDDLEAAVHRAYWWTPLLPTMPNAVDRMVPPNSVDELVTPEARKLYARAGELELRSDGSCPYAFARGGTYHSNITVPEVLTPALGKAIRRSLQTSDSAEALERVRLLVMCLASDLDHSLKGVRDGAL